MLFTLQKVVPTSGYAASADSRPRGREEVRADAETRRLSVMYYYEAVLVVLFVDVGLLSVC